MSVDDVGRLLAALDKQTKDEPRVRGPTPLPLIEPLSERKLEVLRLLATGLSTSEIVQEIFVAISTLRSYIVQAFKSRFHIPLLPKWGIALFFHNPQRNHQFWG